MKAVRSIEGGVAVVDVDEPPGIGEVLDMRATSICGSDLSYIRFGSRNILGHELAGRARGRHRRGGRGDLRLHGVRRSAAAARTTSARRTASGHSASAPTGGWRSSSARRPPGWSRCPRASMCATPPSWSRPSVSWHALRLAGTGPGTRVAVVGAGALGLLAVAGARRLGAEDVALEARHPYQKEAGERLGARVGADGLYDVVVEAAGSEASLARCGELVAPGGTIVVLGVHFGPVQLDWMPLFHKEARVIPSLGYCAHDGGREMEDAAAMLADDPDIARTLITHRFPIEDAAEAFRVASDRAGGAVRVVIEPS